MLVRPEDDADRPVDTLSAVLTDLRAVRGRCYVSRLRSPWGLRFGASDGCVVHLVRGGGARTWVDGVEHRLADGELLVLPHGHAHALGDHPDGVPVAFPERASTRRDWSGGHPDAVDLVCGEVVLAERGGLPLLRALPTVLRVPGDGPVAGVLALLADHADHERPGGLAVVTRLMELLVVHAVRGWAEHAEDAPPWVQGARDPVVGRALAAIHADPGASWTVETLARVCGTSRSRFADRFTRLVGVGPMGWVHRVRVSRAEEALARGERVGAVAHHLGYASPAAFSRAFKRATGRSPRDHLGEAGPRSGA